jgi:hypothetical protein
MKIGTLEFKWTVSRGRDSYGYNICTLFLDGEKVARCNGGGYDMKGTCLGDFIADRFADRLLKLKEKSMPEQSHWEPSNKRRCANLDCLLAKHDVGAPEELFAPDVMECPYCHGATRAASNDGKQVVTGRSFYGLRYINPTFDPGKAVVKHAPVFGKDDDAGKTVAVLEKEGKSLGLERYQAFWSATSKFPTRKHRIPSIDGACGMSSVQEIMRAIKLDIEYVPTKGSNSIYLLHDHKRSRR